MQRFGSSANKRLFLPSFLEVHLNRFSPPSMWPRTIPLRMQTLSMAPGVILTNFSSPRRLAGHEIKVKPVLSGDLTSRLPLTLYFSSSLLSCSEEAKTRFCNTPLRDRKARCYK
ncbi:hypothetical protein AVEN_264988-1 [Araneus ventricosus]|uniref:Uncharacterized protein n=1 Tax=Araneus ventricosus TaxID=182803 RepID=A0A4Y2EQC3_ARAVE|nr:hypothetical protein AVEN_264988-1 [Araneus ventricosus]